ncbi:hypothetical protein Bca4012_084138 [Brassica carinata]
MNIAAETAVSLFVCFDGEMQKLQLHTIEPMKLGIYWLERERIQRRLSYPLLFQTWLGRLTPSRPG